MTPGPACRSSAIPRALKTVVAVAVLSWTAVHLVFYPPATMLWFCALGNVFMAIALLLEHRLLLSMQAIALLIPQTVWTLDALWRVASGARGGGTSYLFNDALPLPVRLLSLFHVLVPPLLLYALSRVGYDPRALRWQLITGPMVLLASYAAGPLNVNGVYAPLAGTDALPPLVHLLAALIAWPVLCWIPTALLLAHCSSTGRTALPTSS
jgi:hypothetical protein